MSRVGSIILSVPRCPKCGEFPRGASVTIAALASVYTDDNGKTFAYKGYVRSGGSYSSRLDEKGRVTLVCGGEHHWKAELVDRT